jgi:hypothetical protein
MNWTDSNYHRDSRGYLVHKRTGKPRHDQAMEKKFGRPLTQDPVVDPSPLLFPDDGRFLPLSDYLRE